MLRSGMESQAGKAAGRVRAPPGHKRYHSRSAVINKTGSDMIKEGHL